MNIKKIWQKIKPEIKYILLLFLVTRILLTVIGVSSSVMLDPYHGEQYVWKYNESRFLDVWGVWDTGWYLSVADRGYDKMPLTDGPVIKKANYAFFPVYPMLIKGGSYITGDYYTSALIISNISLLIACYYLFKLVKIDLGEKTAYNSIKYLILFPTAFIFSGAFSEATFIALLLMAFYYAKKQKWLYVGIAGFFLALTRSLGVIAVLPLFYEYLKSKDFKIKNIKYDFLYLGMIPLGLLTFMVYTYQLTGDFFAFQTIQESWHRSYANPLITLYKNMTSNDIYMLYLSWPTVAFMGFLTIFYKKIGFSYWFLGMYSLIIPLLSGIYSMPRFMLPIFPMYILLAQLSKNETFNQIATISLALIQGFFMVFWANGFKLII